MMSRSVLSYIGVMLLGSVFLHAAVQQLSSPAPSSPHRAVLNRYCVTCHNEKLKTADLILSNLNIEDVGSETDVWEKVVRKLRAGAMPPLGLPRPDQATYDSFATYLETELDRAAASPDPGRTPAVHRLNRAEYTNAIRDLLAVDIDGASLLPADDSGLEFDNMADVLSVSPLLMETYMSVAGKVRSLALGDTDLGATTDIYKVPERFIQDDRMDEDLPFGSRGGIAVRHPFPVDGEYVIRIRLVRSGDGYIRGIRGDRHQLDVRLNGARLKLFTIGGVNLGPSGPLYPRNGTFYRGDAKQIEYEFNADENFEVHFPAKAGTQLVQVTFLKQTSAPDGILLPPPMYPDIVDFKGGDPALASITIRGPFETIGPGETPSRHRIFLCNPTAPAEEEACATKILSLLARRAYRQPVTNEHVQPLLHLYRTARSRKNFEAAIGTALQAILVSPEFLFRIERDPPNVASNTAYSISDVALASRLSFFLWSSIPDDELLDLAEKGKLSDPVVLQQQVSRMVADSRSKALVNNFAGQWLYLRNMRDVSPDPELFPDFDDELREAMQKETELFFESMLREDRSVLDLLMADYTFVNERLARHYEIPNVYGSRLRQVTLTDEARKGLLGQGSILTLTSKARRTSPVLRGKWVLEQLLGLPPPPPPPNVPLLEEQESKGGKPVSVRQMMEQHRQNPTCASCHKIMDPIGLALENFNAVGQWRTVEANVPVDASGVFYDGSEFQNVVEFRQVLLNHPERFVYTVAEKLLTYALGREIHYYDAPAVRKIVREAALNDYRWSALITSIARSTPFQMRRSQEQ